MKEDMIFPARCHCGSKSSEHRYGETRYICAHCKRPLWQTIATAPKDGTSYLAFGFDEDGESCVVECSSDYGAEIVFGDNGPTHWMPMPEGPGDE